MSVTVEISLSWNEKRRAWYKWHPALRKTVYVAGDVSVEEAWSSWLLKKESYAKARPIAVRQRGNATSLANVCNRYLSERRQDAESGDLSLQHFDSMSRTLAHLVKFLGRDITIEELTPDHWTAYARHLAQTAPRSRRRARAILLTMFRQADDDDWIDHLPKFGKAFRKLAHTHEVDPIPPFSRDDCQKILSAIDRRLQQKFRHGDGSSLIPFRNLKAAFLLGLNGGLLPADLARLRRSDLNLEQGFIRYRRPKTNMPHRIALWPETVKALQVILERDDQGTGLVMLTKNGKPVVHQAFSKETGRVNLTDSISSLFRETARCAGVRLKLPGRPKGKGLSRLRQTCRTVASELGDESAADILVGHRLPGMRAVYLTVTDDRLHRVAQHVHDWLFTPHIAPGDPRNASKSDGE